jgi:hypothetical protein
MHFTGHNDKALFIIQVYLQANLSLTNSRARARALSLTPYWACMLLDCSGLKASTIAASSSKKQCGGAGEAAGFSKRCTEGQKDRQTRTHTHTPHTHACITPLARTHTHTHTHRRTQTHTQTHLGLRRGPFVRSPFVDIMELDLLRCCSCRPKCVYATYNQGCASQRPCSSF